MDLTCMADIVEGESSDPDLQELFAIIKRGQDLWIHGQPEGFAQHERMSIYGPFGGSLRYVSGDSDPRQAAIRAQFLGGVSAVEIKRSIRTGSTAVVVSLATCLVRFAGRQASHSWVLRVTEVYDHQGGNWIRLHRHADPLIAMRPLDETLEHSKVSCTRKRAELSFGPLSPQSFDLGTT